MVDQSVQARVGVPSVPRQRSALDAVSSGSTDLQPRHRTERADRSVRVPAQRRRASPGVRVRRRGTWWALAVPVVVVSMGAVAAAGSGLSLLTTGTTKSRHSFTLVEQSGGLVRAPERDADVAESVASVRDSYQLQFMGRLSQFVDGAYVNRVVAAGRPAGTVVFVGAAVDTSDDPAAFVSTFRAHAEQAGYVVTEPAVGAGARAVCSESPATSANGAVTSCAWSTGDAIGQLVPTVDGWSAASLGSVLRDFRRSVEVTTSA